MMYKINDRLVDLEDPEMLADPEVRQKLLARFGSLPPFCSSCGYQFGGPLLDSLLESLRRVLNRLDYTEAKYGGDDAKTPYVDIHTICPKCDRPATCCAKLPKEPLIEL